MLKQARPRHKLEGSEIMIISRTSWRIALLFRGSSTLFEKLTESFHDRSLRSALLGAAVVAASQNILKQWTLKCYRVGSKTVRRMRPA